MKRATITILAFILISMVVLPVIAGEGRIPIWRYPTAISAPGKYIVTRNIQSGGGPAPVIDIQAPNVDIDLNGFVLDGTGSPAPVINIIDDIVDVVIRNGSLIGGATSIERNIGAGTIGQRVVIEDVQAKNPDGTAIYLFDVRNVVIRRVNIIDPGSHGVHLDGTGTFKNGTIEDCSVRKPGTDGIHVDNGSALAIRHNRIEVAFGNGIHLVGSYAVLVGENTISDSDQMGIWFEQTNGGKIYNNVISRGEQNGIWIDAASNDNLLLDNLVRQSGWGGAAGPGFGGGNGIMVDGQRNHLENNTVNESDACGLLFNGFANTFGRNMARGNDPTGSFCIPATCALLFPPNSCDNGAGNDTFGDNLIPGPPIF